MGPNRLVRINLLIHTACGLIPAGGMGRIHAGAQSIAACPYYFHQILEYFP